MGLQFPFPFIDVLILPTDASTGPRIVLDGTTGVIEIYDANGDLYATIDPDTGFSAFNPSAPNEFVRLLTDPTESPIIEFGQDDADVSNRGYIQQYITGAGGTRQLIFEFSPGWFTTSTDNARVTLSSESADSTVTPVFAVRDADILVLPPAPLAGLTYSPARGKIAQQELTANSAPVSGDGTGDMSLTNVPVYAGRLYGVHMHSRYDINAAGEWAAECHLNGTKIGEFGFFNHPGASDGLIDGTVWWEPSVTTITDDLTLVWNELAGTSTVTLIAAANTPRWLTLLDYGLA